jgi:hypothetical protein
VLAETVPEAEKEVRTATPRIANGEVRHDPQLSPSNLPSIHWNRRTYLSAHIEKSPGKRDRV